VGTQPASARPSPPSACLQPALSPHSSTPPYPRGGRRPRGPLSDVPPPGRRPDGAVRRLGPDRALGGCPQPRRAPAHAHAPHSAALLRSTAFLIKCSPLMAHPVDPRYRRLIHGTSSFLASEIPLAVYHTHCAINGEQDTTRDGSRTNLACNCPSRIAFAASLSGGRVLSGAAWPVPPPPPPPPTAGEQQRLGMARMFYHNPKVRGARLTARPVSSRRVSSHPMHRPIPSHGWDGILILRDGHGHSRSFSLGFGFWSGFSF
jgi:hypothetical protein